MTNIFVFATSKYYLTVFSGLELSVIIVISLAIVILAAVLGYLTFFLAVRNKRLKRERWEQKVAGKMLNLFCLVQRVSAES